MEKENFEKWKKLVLISLIVTGISFILIGILRNGSTIWSIVKIIFFVSLVIYFISLILCAITAKKNGQKLESWINVLKILTIVIVVIWAIGCVVNIGIDKQMDNDTERYLQQWEN